VTVLRKTISANVCGKTLDAFGLNVCGLASQGRLFPNFEGTPFHYL